MIAASEPLEFVPHGRRAFSRHPGSVLKTASANNCSVPDSALLHKLKNVAISEKSDQIPYSRNNEVDTQKERWSIRHITLTKCVKNMNDNNATNISPNKSESKVKKEFNASIRSEMNVSKRMKSESDHPTSYSETIFNDTRIFDIYEPNTKVDCCFEEELYIKDCTAIWSRGLISSPDTKLNDSENRITLTCYTCESPIKHALFCNFNASINDRHMFDALHSFNSEYKSDIKINDNFEETSNESVPSICIIDGNSLRAFTESGEDYITSLQFQVKSAWSTKYGILLEKESTHLTHHSFIRNPHRSDFFPSDISETFSKTNVNPSTKIHSSLFSPDSYKSSLYSESDIPLPTCFSLSHPLDEMVPVLIKSSTDGIQYYNDGNMQIVFVNDSPSICLTYNSKTGLHTLWKLRKTNSEECHSVCGNWNKTFTELNPSDNINIGSFSPFNISNQKMPGGNIPKNITPNWLTSINSPYTTRSVTSNNSNSQLKNNSPMAGMFNKLGLTPHTSIGQASNSSMQATNVNVVSHSQPLYPDICLEHIWTENQGAIRINAPNWSAASKAFLHCDFIGQYYLCYLINGSIQKLFIARLEMPHLPYNDTSQRSLIVGLVSSICAKDAVNISSSNLIATIDLSGNIILYSGLYMIGKVHIGGVLAGLINSPYNQINKFDTSFPRRSSLLPLPAKDITILDDSAFHQLSPVPHKLSCDKNLDYSGLTGLKDPIGNRVTLEYNKDTYYRIALPEVASSSLVLKCITTIKQVIPKDIMMLIISKWYGIRNSPGTQDLCAKLEWSMFVSLILDLLGYDVSKLALTKQPDIGSTEILSKKLKTSNDGSHDDWKYLLNSTHHLAFGNSLATMLNLKSKNDSEMISPSNFKLHPTYSKLNDFVACSQKISDMDTVNQDYSVNNFQIIQFNCNALLFPYFLQILFALHLLYEEIKLNVLIIEELQPLGEFLYQLCLDLRLDTYMTHYWKDFPETCFLKIGSNYQTQISESDIKKMIQPIYFSLNPPNIFNHLCLLMRRTKDDLTYYFLNNVNNSSRDLVEIIGLIANGHPGLIFNINPKDGINTCSTPHQNKKSPPISQTEVEQKAVLMIYNKGYTLKDICNFPPSISLFLFNILSQCKTNPPIDWPHEVYSLIMREDLALQGKLNTLSNSVKYEDESMKENAFSQNKDYDSENLPTINKSIENEKNTGLEHLDTKILRLRFPNDHRVTEVSNLLQSSIPVLVAITQRPEVSDHDFIEEQERYLYALCTRTMALPVGRGMVTLRSAHCVITEQLNIPNLCVTGRAPPRNSTVELSHIEISPQYSAWPLFHNGVAAGLKLVPMGSTKIDSAWIVYNKPKQGTVDMVYEHAGFLMALGLNGHLKDMAFMDMYEYFVKCHEMTSVGLLLGIAATYRGTMDLSTTKLMGIHVEALLPPTSIELDIPQNIQVAALLGVGLLYQRTAHTHITQVLLSEIGRPPGPEMENSSEREGYSLAAGLGLGLVCLGAHKTAPHHLTATLRHYMLGGNKRPLTGAQKEKYKLPSFQIREGPTVNLDVTAPGATLALGMLYLKSGNIEVAKWLSPPQTHYLLDFVRPDLLLLRVIARGLILWDSIEPTEEWIESFVPSSVKPYCFVKPTEDNIDYEAMNQVYCNIVAGACFSIGLRFAGSANQEACNTILYYAKEFNKLGSKSIGELAGKSTIETCLNLILISAAMVMAGTGDLQIMRLCRQQHARAGPFPTSLTYGSQLAVHSALGLLFLGAGRYTLSTSPESIAALICAFFPKFPTHSNDNRYHLQAFRHLYVLATEPRLLIPRDISSGTLCYANIKIVKLSNETINIKAPCLLPELHTLKEVHIDDSRYWPIVFKRDMNWDQLLNMLQNLSTVDIKQRAGCLSYLEDPHGFKSLLAQTLTTEKTNVWTAKFENILSFTNNPAIINFTKHYLGDPLRDASFLKKTETGDDNNIVNICSNCYFMNVQSLFKDKNNKQCVCEKNNNEEREYIQLLSTVTYQCVIRDTLIILPIWMTFLKILKDMKKHSRAYHIWQIKLFLAQIENHNHHYFDTFNTLNENKYRCEHLITNEFALSIKQKVASIMDKWESELAVSIKNYASNMFDDKCHNTNISRLVSFLIYYDIPRGILHSSLLGKEIHFIDLFDEAKKFKMEAPSVHTLVRICKMP